MALRHVLFPYDFSSQGMQIVPFVRALAERFGARVTVLGVVPPTFDPVPEAMGGAALRTGDDAHEWARHLKHQLDCALLAELDGLDVSRVVLGGDPAIRIVDFASVDAVDLIAMPTHGIGRFRALLLGSVTAKVLHDAACPVWTAAHTDHQTAAPFPHRILCAVDGAAGTAALAQWIGPFACAFGASLTFLHVVGPVTDWPSLERERRLQEEMRGEAQRTIASMLSSAGVEAPLRTAVGGIVATVVEEARREQVDLVAIGRGSVGQPFGRLRTHAFGIIQRSPCPVVSV